MTGVQTCALPISARREEEGIFLMDNLPAIGQHFGYGANTGGISRYRLDLNIRPHGLSGEQQVNKIKILISLFSLFFEIRSFGKQSLRF